MNDDRDHLDRKIRTLELAGLMRRTIRLACSNCRHVRLLDAASLWWLFYQRRWNDDLPSAIQRFFCAACRRRTGKRHRPRFQITRERAIGDQFSPPDEREWKRLVARFRS